MKEETDKTLKEKFKDAINEVSIEKDTKKLNPQAKTWLNIGGVLIALWASQYVFIALAGAVRGFKDLRRSIREK